MDDRVDSNLPFQADELEALAAIYGDDFMVVSLEQRSYEITIRVESDSRWSMRIKFYFPESYPSEDPPIFELFAECLAQEETSVISSTLNDLWEQNFGQSILYIWIEAMREALVKRYNLYKAREPDDFLLENLHRELSFKEDSGSEGDKEDHLQENKTQPEPITVDFHVSSSDSRGDEVPEFISGSPVTDRKSTFQAHVTRVVSETQVSTALKKLKENRKISNATHNILAYRIVGTNSKSYIQDCDDDGETHAGTRLLHLLQILDAQNVLVVVSRWYGGILLGPDRFKHISNCARAILTETGFTNRSEDVEKSAKEKKNVKHQSKVKKK